jgi:predicted outer membrane protein
MSHSKIVLGVAALLPTVMLGVQQPSDRSPAVSPVEVTTTSNEGDQLLATWLMAACNNEVAVARIAVRRAQSPEVREFAQKMVDDHTRFTGMLLPFTADADGDSTHGVSGKGADDARKGERKVAEASSRAPEAKGQFDHLALINDLSTRCLESQTKMLAAKKDADFDQGFMQMQVNQHGQAGIMVEVFSKYASVELRPTLEQAGKSLREHLEQAKTLCNKCDSIAKVGKPLGDQKK